MDTLAPQSILDNRSRSRETTGRAITDRITRRRSPGRSPRQSQIFLEDDEDVVIRVPQPYRTSFSAIVAPSRERRDRSRSVSPASSLRTSRHRSKSPGHRKHVRYDTRVTVRHSDTDDSVITSLTGMDASPLHRKPVSPNQKQMNTPSPSAEGEQYTSHKSGYLQSEVQRPITPNGRSNSRTVSHLDSYYSPHSEKNVSPDPFHDRTVSYRVAVQSDNFSGTDIAPPRNNTRNSSQNLPQRNLGERPHQGRTRSATTPDLEPSSKLNPARKHSSGSLQNFFRKLSPLMGRKKKRPGSASVDGSVQSLQTSEGGSVFGDDESERNNLKRGGIRGSLLNLFRKSKGSSKSKSRGKTPPRSPSATEVIADAPEADKSKDFTSSTSRILKSIEQNNRTEKDMYHKFKERQVSKSVETAQTNKSPALQTPSPVGGHSIQYYEQRFADYDPHMNKENSSQYVRYQSKKVDDSLIQSEEEEPLSELHKAEPPKSLDVRQIPKSVRTLQTSIISTVSGDESIGDCSLDANLTGSEPSLLSGTSQSVGSKTAVHSRDLTCINTSPIRSCNSSGVHRENGDVHRTKTGATHSKSMPRLAQPDEVVIQDVKHQPSYLKLSCSLSGYGRYCSYSSYKNIEKRSPYSSTLSLRSGESSPMSPMMLSVNNVSSSHRDETDHAKCTDSSIGCNKDITSSSTNGTNIVNGIVGLSLFNGHSKHYIIGDPNYPTGDSVKDGEYFLRLTQLEEDRLQCMCSQTEQDLSSSQSLPEEAFGKMRATLGKSNLLLSQKFQQFRDLCYQHINPNESERPTKWEDLQGFWDMVRIQIDDVDDMFTELELMKQNNWQPVQIHSRKSSNSSSPQSACASVGSTPNHTPGHTPGSRRKAIGKDTPESSPEKSQKAKQAARLRDEARKKLLAERRAAMKKQKAEITPNDEVEIFLPENSK